MKNEEIRKWANQKVVIECKMHELADLMDILFMADASPLDNSFKKTLKLNRITPSYYKWLDKIEKIVLKEELDNVSVETNKRVNKNKK